MKLFMTNPPKETMDGFLYTLFNRWHRTMRDYKCKYAEVSTSSTETDLPYVYGEKTQVGLLGIAAYRAQGFPLMEFEQDKKTRTGRGRQDLGTIAGNSCIWDIEAKFLQIGVANPEFEGTVKSKVTEAVNDAKKLRCRSAAHTVGLTFVAPCGASNTRDLKLFSSQVFKVSGSIRNRFSAIHFCERESWRQSAHPDCPGIAIIGQFVP